MEVAAVAVATAEARFDKGTRAAAAVGSVPAREKRVADGEGRGRIQGIAGSDLARDPSAGRVAAAARAAHLTLRLTGCL